MLLRVADPDGRYAAVRLCSDLAPRADRRAFARENGEWRLELAPPPPVSRLEYELEVVHPDGATERVQDPANPHRAPGAFGEKSVLLLPGYIPPRWLSHAGVAGRSESIAVAGRGLGANVDVRIWSPADAEPREPLPLLVAHDGPEYDKLGRLTHFAAAGIKTTALPRHRVALVAPKDRDEWYSASARYAGALTRDVLPAITAAAPTASPLVAMGASLGALAMLHAHRRHPGTFGALFLQSGSFFSPRFDAHEAGFPRYQRIVRFVRETHRAGRHERALLTCGSAEENIHNNRLMAHTLVAALHELPDTHNYTAWRDALDPHLTRLLADTW